MCHAGTGASAGLRLDTWENVMAGSDFGEAVIPFDDDNSLMIKMLTRLVDGPHPAEVSADTLVREEIEFLRRWINLGARFDAPIGTVAMNAGPIPSTSARQLLFVPNEEDALISVIDIEQLHVIRTIDLIDSDIGQFNFTPNARPTDIELEPDGTSIYVSLSGDNSVIKISIAGALLTGSVSGVVPFQSPGMLGLNPITDQLYVGRSINAVSPPRSLGEIMRSDLSFQEIELDFQRPHALAVDPSGEFAFSASLAENVVLTVETGNSNVSFAVVDSPFNAFTHFAISPDGTRLAASSQDASQVSIVDTSAPPGVQLDASFPVGAQPWHPVWTMDSKRVYVGNRGDNTISVLDMDNPTAIQTISGSGIAQPHGSAVSPDGSLVFISNQNKNGTYIPRYNFGNNQDTGTVVVINTATNEIEKVIEVGRAPAGLSTIIP